MLKWHAIQAGDLLWEVKRERAGGTTMLRWASRRVEVKSIDHEAGTAVVSWNGNPVQTWSAWRLTKLRRSPYKPKGVK